MLEVEATQEDGDAQVEQDAHDDGARDGDLDDTDQVGRGACVLLGGLLGGDEGEDGEHEEREVGERGMQQPSAQEGVVAVMLVEEVVLVVLGDRFNHRGEGEEEDGPRDELHRVDRMLGLRRRQIGRDQIDDRGSKEEERGSKDPDGEAQITIPGWA